MNKRRSCVIGLAFPFALAAVLGACGEGSGSSGTVPPPKETTTSSQSATTIPDSQPPTGSPGGAMTVPGAQPSVPGATPGQDIDDLDPPGGTFPGPETESSTP